MHRNMDKKHGTPVKMTDGSEKNFGMEHLWNIYIYIHMHTLMDFSGMD